jgi:2-desacetyl-2-hydroxyethyl bacteriochlorophyllide A dehydrogenase
MRSAQWTGSTFQVDELAHPEPGPGEISVRVAACGVCVTEVHFVDGYYDSRSFDIPARMGHEFGGVVEAVGPGVDLAPGTLVGAFGAMGGFGEVAVAPADAFRRVSPDLPPHLAAFLEPVAACANAVIRARIPLGATVLVTGGGSNGLIITQLARRAGAARVVVSEPDPGRRAAALELGADMGVDPSATPIREALDGEPIDVAIDSTGFLPALSDCLAAVKKDGTVVMFGVSRESARLELPLLDFHLRDTTLVASMGASDEASRASGALLGSLDLEPIVSHRYSLDQVNDAFETARTGAGLKVLVFPS